MILIEAPQGSDAWHAARVGTITASMAETILDKYKTGANKGGYKAAALDYAFRLAAERIAGHALDEDRYETWSMRRGHEEEPNARALHAWVTQQEIQPVGIAKSDDELFGASADGIIGHDGGAEYKCLVDPARLRAILFDGDLSDFTAQIQFGMWITGRQWWDFVLYCPALKDAGLDIYIERVARDDHYIAGLAEEMHQFNQLVEQYRARLIEQGARAQAPAWKRPAENPVAGAFGG